jgi:hypothetical protein
MNRPGEIFLHINLPNAATWFYFSLLLGIALFFKFSRLLSIRNWDVLTLYLLVPGLLLLIESNGTSLVGYGCLLGASGYFLARCLFDLALERRPALAPNLNLSGLVWLGCALYLSLVTIAIWQPRVESSHGRSENPPIDHLVKPVTDVAKTTVAVNQDDATLRQAIERGLMLACHLSIVAGMVLIGWRHFDDIQLGVAAATFYLLIPYTHILLPSTGPGLGRWDHAWAMALMVWMVLAYRYPVVTGSILGVAAGSIFFPIMVLPIWLSFYWGRGSCRFLLAFVLSGGLCLALIGALLWMYGGVPLSLRSVWTPANWLPWMDPLETARGVWRKGGPSAYRLPVFLGYMTLVIMTLFWPAPKDLAHVLALSAAVLIGIQFWYGDQGGVYILWYLPYLLLIVFRPNLSHCRPPPRPEDWLTRALRHLGQAIFQFVHGPEPAAHSAGRGASHP